MSNLSLEYFQALKKLHRYLLGARLALKYIGVLGAYIVLEMLLNNNICLNAYSDLD